MYKKRFAKWGFHKNVRRTRSKSTDDCGPRESPSTLSTSPSETHHTAETPEIVPSSPKLTISDTATLFFLTNIRIWSSTFYELAELPDRTWATIDSTAAGVPLVPYHATMIREYKPESLSYSFRVVVGLLERGHGVLAGRLARKAFLQTEALLQIEGPLFVWNILEILYHMVLRGQTQLFDMLLCYLVGLARSYYPDSHPVIQVLQSLRILRQSWLGDSTPLQAAALEQGWKLNADILFSKFDPRFLLLYYRLMWDSSILKLSQDRLRDADRWFALLNVKFPPDDAFLEELTGNSHPNANGVELPSNYERLKADALAAIHGQSTLERDEPILKIRVLSGLLKSRVLEETTAVYRSPTPVNRNPDGIAYTPRHEAHILRLHARILAFVIKVLMEAEDAAGCGTEAATDRIRSIIALRKYGQTPVDPQIVHELWLLEELLLKGGRPIEAAAARQETYRLLEEYLNDVPAEVVYIPTAQS